MKRGEDGCHELTLEGIDPGTRYTYVLEPGLDLPDPASRSQPEGVHAPSEVASQSFDWTDAAWSGQPLRDYIVYELHVGTFTSEGTFDAIIPQLPRLVDLGVTAVEIMPVAQFPGDRNWGYDGVYPYAVQSSYGGPEALKRLVDACHKHRLSVILDVVYNHLGPEGNYLGQFGPYFTDRYRTPWGDALNFDGPQSDDVRRFFIENGLCWQTEFHMDALRLDAVHAIRDHSAIPFLRQLKEATHRQSRALGRRFHLIAESDDNNARLIAPPSLGGDGMDAQWSDDFHHALHVQLTGELSGYYADFDHPRFLAAAWREGFAFTGQFAVYRGRTHGSLPRDRAVEQFVVCSQNHDQVGNRLLGDRLTESLDLPGLKLAAGAVLLSPFTPMLFMGEEYGETAPFQYFISHSDPELIRAVQEGRSREFAAFQWKGEVPDPQAEETFSRCILNPALLDKKPNRALHDFYRELIVLRRGIPSLTGARKGQYDVRDLPGRILTVHNQADGDETVILFAFGEAAEIQLPQTPGGPWRKRIDSEDARWGGAGSAIPERISGESAASVPLSAHSLVVLQRASA